jgi:HipA-like protein
MPIREEPYGDPPCEAFFGGLLPESEIARHLIGKRYGVSPHNSFALLRAIG